MIVDDASVLPVRVLTMTMVAWLVGRVNTQVAQTTNQQHRGGGAPIRDSSHGGDTASLSLPGADGYSVNNISGPWNTSGPPSFPRVFDIRVKVSRGKSEKIKEK